MASRRVKRLATAPDRLGELPVLELEGGQRVHEARTWVSRRDGLAGLPDLPDDWGLWIAPCRSIHTFGMRFALDLVWLGRGDEVVRVDHDVAPRRQRTCWRSRSVIEVPAGQGDRLAAAWRPRG